VIFEKAIAMAEERDMDLVEVAGNANPTVCRIMDFHKYRYEQRKRTQESKRKSKSAASSVKEVKIRSRTEAHDIDFKIGHIRRFLGKGHRVKISVFFKGREITRPEFGRETLARVLESISDVAVADGTPRMEGRHMSLMVVPLKSPTGGAAKPVKAKAERVERVGTAERVVASGAGVTQTPEPVEKTESGEK